MSILVILFNSLHATIKDFLEDIKREREIEMEE